MDVLNFVDAVVAFLNIGIFSTLICRFTGANMAMLVFCALLYMGSEPMETVGIMLTYLVFMRLTIYTQKRKLNFKKLQVFKGMRVFVPVLLIVISLFLYPFAALAIFLLLFMVEILAQIKAEIPEDRQLSKGELTKYIVIGSLLTTVSMIAVKFIPAAWYYALGGAVGLFLCGFVWWLGQDRDRLSGIWDTVILLSFIPLGLFGFDAIRDIAHVHGLPVIIDNTFATPYLFRPLEHGLDIVVHSTTKFIGGHGTTLGGAIVENGKFNWNQPERYPHFASPDSSYHGINFATDVPGAGFVTRIRAKVLRDTGACISPISSWFFIQGLETLSLRVERHVYNATRVAEFLEKHPKVAKVNYPGLASSPYHKLQLKYLPKGAGSIFSIELKDGFDAARKFIDNLEIFSNLANVGDSKSLVVHPASTTHQQLSQEAQQAAGITPGTVRISVGIENIDDLLADLEQALSKI